MVTAVQGRLQRVAWQDSVARSGFLAAERKSGNEENSQGSWWAGDPYGVRGVSAGLTFGGAKVDDGFRHSAAKIGAH